MKENHYYYLSDGERVLFLKTDPQTGEAVIRDSNGSYRAVNPSTMHEAKQ